MDNIGFIIMINCLCQALSVKIQPLSHLKVNQDNWAGSLSGRLTLRHHLSLICLQRLRSTLVTRRPSLVLLRPGVRLPSGAAT